MSEKKFVPNHHLGQLRYIGNLKLKEVSSFAESYFERRKEGIKFENLERKFGISKENAQRILKRGVQANYLFIIGRTKPQIYYPVRKRPAVLDYLSKIVPINTTGTDSCNSVYAKYDTLLSSETLERRRADSLFEALMLTYTSPRFFHNVHLQCPIGREYYYDIDAPIHGHTKAKKLEHRIDGNIVTYRYYPNGTVTPTIACTKNPFKIETPEDEYTVHAYLGQVRGKMLDHVSDSRGSIVPPISQWLLLECDVNIDIEVSDSMQLSFPKIQIYPNRYVMQIQGNLSCKSFFDVLRMYIKAKEDKAFLRFEGLMSPCLPVLQVLQDLRYPRELLYHNNVKLQHGV